MQVYPEPVRVDFVIGETTRLALPAHAQALRAAGAAFLTRAFQAYGSLAPDNRVTAIVRFERCHAGNSGDKLFLSLEYEHPEPGLHSELFVKFSRDFDDAFRDRRRYELEPEIRLMTLSRAPGFPVTVAKPYFADFEPASGTGLMITERIAFGENGIEPPRPKNMDHELADPAEYYRATLTALARLAAAHRSGRLPGAEALFPFDAAAASADIPFRWSEAELDEKLERFAEFAAECPQLLPANIATPAFAARLKKEAPRFLRHEAQMRRFLHSNPDLIALTHWNVHLDNAWFWRDAGDVLQCGLLDWGMVRQMNLGYGIWGSVSSANLALWPRIDGLLADYARELHEHGGPAVDVAELTLNFELAATVLSLGLYLDAPTLIRQRLPSVAQASGPLDPLIRQDSVVHGFLNGFSNFLYLFETRDFGASLDRMLERVGVAQNSCS